MQKPEIVLNNLTKQTVKEDYKFKNLYRYLYNPDFHLRAYSKLYMKEGNMTEGVDGKTIDGFGMDRINDTIQKLRDLSYHPHPSKRVYITKKNGKLRPLGIPSIEDKIVQEIMREILEAIYEPKFSDSSHGFRPNRSCHTALRTIKTSCTGMKWWIEGDIEGFFDNINHHVLVKLLRNKIEDEKFINLIWKFLKAGYVENWKFNNTYTGTPQGGIISPIMANIYLNELDQYMEEYVKQYNSGKERAKNKEYKRHNENLRNYKNRLVGKWESLSEEEKQEHLKEIKEREKVMRSIPSRDPQDQKFKRIKYVRYADDFIIGCIGSIEDAKKIKGDVKVFLMEKLKLTLSPEKTKITNTSKKARFLGYDIYVANTNEYKKLQSGITARTTTGHVMLSLPFDVLRDFVFKNGYVKEVISEEKQNKWKSCPRVGLRNIEDLEIVMTYNSEIRGFYNYYKLASDVCKIGNIHNLAKYSCLKTLANKYKTSCAKILANKVKGHKFTNNGEFGVYYLNKNNEKDFRAFIANEFKVDKSKMIWEKDIDIVPNTHQYTNSLTGVVQRLNANQCEICGKTEGRMEVHHVRKLKELKGKKRWEQIMIARKRKTIVLCHDCHWDLHNGKLD